MFVLHFYFSVQIDTSLRQVIAIHLHGDLMHEVSMQLADVADQYRIFTDYRHHHLHIGVYHQQQRQHIRPAQFQFERFHRSIFAW